MAVLYKNGKMKKEFADKMAAGMRKKPTHYERKFKNKLLEHYRGVRCQYPFCFPGKTYIVDFFIPSKKLVIELDGKYHDDPIQQFNDTNRDRVLRAKGYHVLRLKNQEINGMNVVVFIDRWLYDEMKKEEEAFRDRAMRVQQPKKELPKYIGGLNCIPSGLI